MINNLFGYEKKVIKYFNRQLKKCDQNKVRFRDVPILVELFIERIPEQFKLNILNSFQVANTALMADALLDTAFDIVNNKIKVLKRDEIKTVKDILMSIGGVISLEGKVGQGKDNDLLNWTEDLIKEYDCYFIENITWQRCIRTPSGEDDDGEWEVAYPSHIFPFDSICELLQNITNIRLPFSYDKKPIIVVVFSELAAFLARLRGNTKLLEQFKILLQFMRKWGVRIIITSPDWNDLPKKLTGTKSEQGVIQLRLIKSKSMTKEVNEKIGSTYHCDKYSELTFGKIIETAEDRIHNEVPLDDITFIYQSKLSHWNKDPKNVRKGQYAVFDKNINFFNKLGKLKDGSDFDLEHYMNSFYQVPVQEYDKHSKEYFETCGFKQPAAPKSDLDIALEKLEDAIRIAPYPAMVMEIVKYDSVKLRWPKEAGYKTHVNRKWKELHGNDNSQGIGQDNDPSNTLKVSA